jgi:hypothetical protein
MSSRPWWTTPSTARDYDELLREGYDQDSARYFVAAELTAILESWGVRRRLSSEE